MPVLVVDVGEHPDLLSWRGAEGEEASPEAMRRGEGLPREGRAGAYLGVPIFMGPRANRVAVGVLGADSMFRSPVMEVRSPGGGGGSRRGGQTGSTSRRDPGPPALYGPVQGRAGCVLDIHVHDVYSCTCGTYMCTLHIHVYTEAGCVSCVY